MPSVPIVIYLNILEYRRFHLLPRVEPFPVDELHFQAVEEAFRTGVIVSTALRTHAAYQSIVFDNILIFMGTVLAPPVGVNYHAARHLPPPQRYFQRIARQLRRHSFRHRPAHYPTL